MTTMNPQTRSAFDAVRTGGNVQQLSHTSWRVLSRDTYPIWVISTDGSGSMTGANGSSSQFGPGTFDLQAILDAWNKLYATGSVHGAQPGSAPGGAPPAPRGTRGSAARGGVQGRGYTVSGSPAHAYDRRGKDLGLLVGGPGGKQVVQPTNGGRLWSLGNLAPDGTVTWVGAYGSVPGAPPPPNARANAVPQQMAPPPRPAPAPPAWGAPAPAFPIGAVDPSGQYAWSGTGWVPVLQPAAPAYAAPLAAPYAAPGVPPYDPTQAALFAGAAYGAEAAMAAQQQDPLTASILAGGGVPDFGGSFSGMAGGFDAETIAALSGGDPDAALQMMLDNGGYDPTAGFTAENPLPG
jgi:hypothetical protein